MDVRSTARTSRGPRERRRGGDQQDLDRLGTATGLVASLAVGLPALLAAVQGRGEPDGALAVLWWLAYAGHLAAFLVFDRQHPRRPGWLSDRALLAAMAVCGASAYALAPRFGWTAVLLVVTAVCGAFVLPPRAAALLVAAQTALVAVVSLAAAPEPLDAAIAALVYGGFQAFGVVVVRIQRRESEARASLARAHAELRTATALLEETSRTAERLRIARELHDLVGHQLTALTLELEVASHRPGDRAAEHVERARRIAKDLLADVRTAVGDLRATNPDLRRALQSVVADLPGLHVHLEVAADVDVDEDRTLALVRCVQEITTNALRHADAANLHIAVTRRPDGGVLLEAHDDGRGSPDLRPGNGLTGLRERVEALGGAFGISAADGQGVRLVAEVPAP